MKILIFNWRDINHPWAGGAERHLHELAKRWIKKGHKVTFIVGGYKGALGKEDIDGIEIIRMGNTYTSFFISPLYYLFKLRKEKYDCIIDTAHGIPFFLPLFSTKPVILIIHHNHKKLWESEFGEIVSQVGIFIEKNIVPLVYKNCTVITLAFSEKKYLLDRGFRKVVAIPPGIDTLFFNKSKEKTQKPTILYLGRLRKYKRVNLLIGIFTRIKRKIKNVTLIIVGEGQDRANIEYLIRKMKLEKSIILKGFVSEEEKRNLLSSSWVLAFPSLMEGWGLVAMEAAACGTPTAGFNVPGVKDAVKNGKSGLLASTKNEFTKNIIKILENKNLRNELSKNSVLWTKNFTWEKSSNNFLEEIKNVINEKK
jgi:glycosyltransferase involved in cell wall biosynthesis